MGRGGGAMPGGGRGRGSIKNMPKKDAVVPPSQNGISRKNPDDIEILHTETLIKEVIFLHVFLIFGIFQSRPNLFFFWLGDVLSL